MNIDGKIYRNLPQQVKKNKDDIEKLQEGFTQSGYTKAEADAKFADKLDTEASIAGIQTYINSDKTAMAQLQAKVDKNTTDIAAQDSKIQTATEAATNASGVAQNAYTAATEAKEATDATTVQVNELTSSVDALDLYTSTLNTDLQNTKKRVNANEGDITALNTAIDNINKAIPTDIAVINGKLGLEHDSVWLPHQKAIILGDNLTYDEATNTLNAVGDYYTRSESDNKYAAKTSVYTKDESNSKFETISDASKEHTELSTRISINETDIANAENEISNLSTVTQSLEQNKQDKLTAGDNITIDTSNRISAVNIYTKDESDEKYQLKGDYVTTTELSNTLEPYALRTEIPTDFYTKSQSDEKYALKTAIPTDFYTREQSDEKYAWKVDVDDRFYTKIQSDLKYATKTTLDTNYYNKSEINNRLNGFVSKNSLTNTLSDYALKTDIPTDFYTRAQSDEKYQPKGTYVVHSDLDAYETKSDLTTTLESYSTTEQMNAAINTAITGAIEGAY